MTPIVSAAPAPEVSTRLGEFDARRRRFYTLFVTFQALSVLALLLVAVVYPTDGIEARLPEWLSEVMALVLPGLPTLVLEFAEKFPWTVLTVGVAIWLIRRASHVVKEAAQEYAFQAWRRTPAAGSGQVQDVTPPRGGLLWAPPRVATLGLAAAVVLVVFVNTLSPQRAIVRADAGLSSCRGAPGDCRLAAGESRLVVVRADEPRNETGVLLEAGERYTARFVGLVGWKDAHLEPEPEGFEFDRDAFGLRKFWWLEWRRPYPEGRWFQVVGRIDRDPGVFPILDADDASTPFTFIAPRDGELVLLVNDVPYENNAGVMTIEISRP